MALSPIMNVLVLKIATVVSIMTSFVAPLSTLGVMTALGSYGEGDLLLMAPFQQYIEKQSEIVMERPYLLS